MCGINGIFGYHYAANPVDRDELVRVRDRMAPRGPDAYGEWLAACGRIGLGHRRLAIIDLSETGAQPMATASGNLVITFNGEIYNYRELRRDLEARGHVFRGSSDTEVLLQLYAARGESMVPDLRGMFAFAIWDADRQRLLLARDTYGIKPLYYADDGWTFRFASQVKALQAGGTISRDPDPAGRCGFFMWGNVPEPFTSFREIRALPAGSTMVVDAVGAHQPKRYRSVGSIFEAAEAMPRSGRSVGATRGDTRAALHEALVDSVRHHLVADVPVGLFLSAGIDSSALLGLMRDAGCQDIQSLTISFGDFRGTADDQLVLASAAARHYGTRHHERVVTEAEFQADLPLILNAMDQPSIDGLNSWFVAKGAREIGLKVAISGLGGDELFGGYPSFGQVPRWVGRVGVPARIPFLGSAVRCALLAIKPGRWEVSPKAAGVVELGGSYAGAYYLRRGLFMPWELPWVLDRDTIRDGLARLDSVVEAELPAGLNSTFAKMSTLESAIYMRNQLLRDADWTSMAHGLEVRVPLVDHVLAATVATLAGDDAWSGAGKQLLAQAPRKPVLVEISNRAKTGFHTPIATWIDRADLLDGATPCQGAPLRVFRHWSRRWAQVASMAQWTVSGVPDVGAVT